VIGAWKDAFAKLYLDGIHPCPVEQVGDEFRSEGLDELARVTNGELTALDGNGVVVDCVLDIVLDGIKGPADGESDVCREDLQGGTLVRRDADVYWQVETVDVDGVFHESICG